MGGQLEGPGSGERLASLQAKFRALDTAAARRAMARLAMLGGGVFLAVVAIDMLSIYGLLAQLQTLAYNFRPY
jgi:hypothetical protein